MSWFYNLFNGIITVVCSNCYGKFDHYADISVAECPYCSQRFYADDRKE